jgi:hypothetical protein
MEYSMLCKFLYVHLLCKDNFLGYFSGVIENI